MKNQIDWLHRLLILLTGVFLFTFMTWFSSYWESVTEKIILTTLIVFCIIEMFLPVKLWIRRIWQSVFVVLFMGHYLAWNTTLPLEYSWHAVFETVWQFILEGSVLFPYIWFAVGTLLVYETMIRWFGAKWRVVITVLCSTIIMSVVDTFTAHYLVNDIVILVCAGLSLLVVQHFQMLKKKSPEGWDHLKDYPETVVLPIGLFFLAVLLINAFTPESVRPLLTDPYTAWKNYLGEEPAITRYSDMDEFSGRFDSSERRSGYSRDDSVLGGSFEFDHSLVFTVDTNQPAYYRGEVRSYYTGTGWKKSEAESHFIEYQFLSEEDLEMKGNHFSPVNRSLLETKEVTQTIHFPEDSPYSGQAILGAYAVKSVEVSWDEEREERGQRIDEGVLDALGFPLDDVAVDPYSPFLWLPEVDELHYVGSEETYPNELTIVSDVPIIDEDALRDVELPDGNEAFWSQYIELPEEIPQRISQLAEEITEEYDTIYDKVRGIETYLRENYTYTNQPDESDAQSEDFVDRFLFEVNEGYCDYFSTAMVILTRTLDIPSRWVKGYTEGSRYTEDEMLYMDYLPEASGPYEVRNTNAHSWVEVYFEGYGWIPFEPTSAFVIPNVERDDQQEETFYIDTVESGEVEEEDEKTFTFERIFPYTIGLIFAVSIILGGLLLWKRKDMLLQWWLNRKGELSYNELIIIDVEKLMLKGRKRGFPRAKNETLGETFEQWSEKDSYFDSQFKNDLTEMLQLFNIARYGNEVLGEEDYKKFKKHMKAVIETINEKK